MTTRLFFFIFALSLGACAFTTSFDGQKRSYPEFVEAKVKEERLFVGGEQRLAMKVLVADKELHSRQSEVAPGFEFELQNGEDQLIVAVSSQNRIPFMRDELKFMLDKEAALRVEELTSNFTIQTLYPYAFPYYRVFVVDFKGNSTPERTFQLQTARGPLSVKLQFRSASQNRVD